MSFLTLLTPPVLDRISAYDVILKVSSYSWFEIASFRRTGMSCFSTPSARKPVGSLKLTNIRLTVERYILEGAHLDPTVGEVVRGALIPDPGLEASFPEPHPTAGTRRYHP